MYLQNMASIKFFDDGKYEAILRKDDHWLGLTTSALTELVNIAKGDGEFDLDVDTKLTFTSSEGKMQYCFGRTFKTSKGNVLQKRCTVILSETEWNDTLRKVLSHRGIPDHKRPKLDLDISDELVINTSTPTTPTKIGFGTPKRKLSFSEVNELEPMDLTRSHLGRDRYVNVSKFGDALYAHIRVHARDGNKLIPSTRGIALTPQQWSQLVSYKDDINNSFRKDDDEGCMKHLGAGKYASVSNFNEHRFVQIRQYWMPENCTEPKPTKKGVTLNADEWENLYDLFDRMNNTIGELRDVKPCWAQEDHLNQYGALECRDCNPWNQGY